jgi:putative addiction module component (TIGR02574 family)
MALSLSETEREVLADEILASLSSEIEAHCLQEAERRIDAYERGEMGVSPAEEVFERIRSRRKR